MDICFLGLEKALKLRQVFLLAAWQPSRSTLQDFEYEYYLFDISALFHPLGPTESVLG